MSSHKELQIKLAARKMMVYGYNAIKQMPKSEKHVLGADIRNAMQEFMRQVIVCEKMYHKGTTLRELDTSLEILRVLVSVAFENKYIPIRSYENWSKHLNEIGDQVGGWIKWYRAQEQDNRKIK